MQIQITMVAEVDAEEANCLYNLNQKLQDEACIEASEFLGAKVISVQIDPVIEVT